MLKFGQNKFVGLVSLILSALVFMVVVITSDNSILSYVLMLALITIAIIFNSDLQFISPAVLFLAYFLYSVAIGPIILMSEGTYFETYSYHKIIVGGILAFAIGNFVFSLRKTEVRSRGDSSRFRVVGIDRITVLYILYFITVMLSLVYIFQNRGSLFGGNLESARVDAVSGNGAMVYLMQSSIVILPMLFDIYYESNKTGKPLINKYLLIIMIAFSSLLLFASGYRAPVMTLLICLIVMYAGKTNMKATKIIILGLLCIVGVTLLGVIRTTLSGGSSGILTSLMTSLYVHDLNLNYVFRTFPDKVDFQNGYTYLINFIMLLPGPDQDFTMWLKDQIGISFSGGGVTPTILGEFYINFGTNSIYIGMFALGAISVYLKKYFIKHKESFMAVFMVWQFAHCVSGGIANVSITLILYLCMYKVILMFPVKKGYEENMYGAIGVHCGGK